MTRKLKQRTTARGFDLIEFDDIYEAKCSLQKSSLATEDAIWLGAEDGRMHLNQDLVRELLPYLTRFAEQGDFDA